MHTVHVAITAALVVFYGSAASAEPPLEASVFRQVGVIVKCRGTSDAKQRLACYDQNVDLLQKMVSDQPDEETVPPNLSAFKNSDFSVVDAQDLYVAPEKYRGKPIELRNMSCYYAEAGDYRCLAPGYVPVVIFTKAVAPDESRARLERACGTMRSVTTKACRRTIRLVPSDFNEDRVAGYEKRLMVEATTIEIEPERGRR